MHKKILIIMGLAWSISGFSQADVTPLSDSYQPPQTVINKTVRLLPGFHADSRNVIYNNGEVFIARSDNNATGPVISNPPVAYNPASGENYIYTRSYLAPVTSSNNYAPQVQSITYFDGLGRPKQSIAIKSAPSGKDLVTPVIYDGFGRPYLDVLPVPLSTKSSDIHPGIDQNSGSGFYGSYAYSEKKLEDSPLDRIQEQYGPGSDWHSNSKRVTYDYLTNETGEVLKFATSTSWSQGASSSSLSLATGNYYTPSTLYKNKVVDEDDNISYEFKNGQGQTLLVRKMLTSTISADTYYVYNEYDQLAFVISPKASDKVRTQLASANLGETGEILAELSYQYRYDGRKRLSEKKLPGKGWEYMVYDKQDRLVATQDAELGKDKKWLVTKYDQFGRVAFTGMYISTHDYGSAGRNSEQGTADGKGSNNVKRDDTLNTTANNIKIYYNHSGTYPETVSELLSISYYDTYPPYADLPAVGDYDQYGQKFLKQTYTPSGANPNTQISTKGLATASLVKTIPGSTWTKTYTFYDEKARPVYTQVNNHLGGYTKTGSQLDFAGAVLKSYTKHKRGSAATPAEVTINERFVYDHQNRMKQHYHQVDSRAEVLLADNTYDDLGRLINKKVGNNLQELQYAYNIRGWMTGINDVGSPGSKLFAYKIRYNETPAGLTTPNVLNYPALQVQKKYNGNIAEIDWYVKDEVSAANPYRTGYVYDRLNRMKAGFYQNPARPSIGDNSEIIDEYDLNGNIVKLTRFGSRFKGSTTPPKIDELSYVYTGTGNRVTSISDATGSDSGYEGGGGSITYDANGNMKTMPDKGISQIEYNYLNLPTRIEQPNPTSYLYRADGVKLSKTFTVTNETGSTTVKTEYFDGFQYNSGDSFTAVEVLRADDPATLSSTRATHIETFRPLDEAAPAAGGTGPVDQAGAMALNFFPTSEGFYDYKNSKYIYQYKDHLGNARVSYGRNAVTNEAEILDRNDYYPFGMNFQNVGGSDAGSIFDARGTPFNYKYNGKELQETGMYDYGARFYMPDIGRWGVVDPLAEQYRRHSTYNYAMNNPIRFIDPDGRGTEDWIKKDNKWTYDANIKTAEEAKAAKADDFAKNGTVLSNANINGGEAGYVRLNEGGTADYLPNDGTQNQATNSAVAFAGSVGSTLDAIGSALTNFFTNNTGDTFYINAGGLNTNVDNTSYRPGIDKVVDNEGYMGGMLSGGGLGGSLDPKMSQSEAGIGFVNTMASIFASFKPKETEIKTIYDIDSAKVGKVMGKDSAFTKTPNLNMQVWKRNDSLYNKYFFNGSKK